MKAELWKNQISTNLKEALEQEIINLLDEKTKEIIRQNKRLQQDNIYLRRQNKDFLKRIKEIKKWMKKSKIY